MCNVRQEWTLAVFEELYYAANNQKIAVKKKADYQVGLENSRADSASWSRDSYMKDPKKSCAQSRQSYMKDSEKSYADSTALSRKSHKKDLEKSRDDSAAQSRESYLKDPEKSRAWNRESYMKDPEKSRADNASMKPRKLTRKTWRRVSKMKLAWLYPTKVRKQLQPNRLS